MNRPHSPQIENPLLALREQRPFLRLTTAKRLGYLNLTPQQIVVELIAASEVGRDMVLRAEARRALVRYVRAIHLPPAELAYASANHHQPATTLWVMTVVIVLGLLVSAFLS